MRSFLRVAAALSALSFAVPAVAADSYPSRTVKLIVPFGAGGPADVYARFLAKYLSDETKQSFVVEDRPGAGSVIGTDAVAKSTPDGYTLLVMSNTHTVNETLLPKKPFVLMRDFLPVASINSSDLLMVVHPSVPAKNLKELLALARAKPGTLNFGSSGPGSNYHMAAELLKHLTGIDIVHVPYKGSTGMRTDILSGQIQMLFDSVPTMAALIKAGQVRALGTSGEKRSPILPDVPTLAEAGVPGFQATLWVGFMAPAGTPMPIVEKLNAEITKIVSRPDIKAAWEKQGAEPVKMTQPQFKAFMDAQIAKWADVIKANNIKAIN